ncbi:hypothetical protein LMH87_005893 [Akanthomyces muscarius]|uniref:Transaldolase n=1 Tax=Akanthomyces muscarius TaxID=2231603 RepID=A0A9W8QPR7_AKAMU|nr:hypothetical protein LMH87_005893 [Akanthomyces muscarius]KAJ4164209.1 hypothetical protein LMH87_005893 [Akanthomyces muscarius]
MTTLLETLRQTSQVGCDTMDIEVAKSLGPFVDCTSNQAIAYFELSRDGGEFHRQLWKEAVKFATRTAMEDDDITRDELVVEVAMVKLQLAFLPYTTEYVHVQTNPKLSFSTEATVRNAERLVTMFKELVGDEEDENRICIKVPATWEGLEACQILQARGIPTLATTMFCMEQAALAAEARCTYIAPYVNELRVHFDKEFVDEHKAFSFCVEAQSYYTRINAKTRILAASLTSIDDVMRLAGVQHITVSPSLLRELATTPADGWKSSAPSVFTNSGKVSLNKRYTRDDFNDILRNESGWRLAFARSGFGSSHGKIIQAINYFSDFQDKLESMVVNYL